MDFVKRLFGWGQASPASGGSDDDSRQQPQQQQRQPQRQPQSQQRQPPRGKARNKKAAEKRLVPLLTESAAGEGGIQGLDWFQRQMRRDSDGDCAGAFLEEPCRQQQEQQQKEQQQQHKQKQQQQGKKKQQAARTSEQPTAKHQKSAVLQCCTKQLLPAGPSDMLLNAGNVYVVPQK